VIILLKDIKNLLGVILFGVKEEDKARNLSKYMMLFKNSYQKAFI